MGQLEESMVMHLSFEFDNTALDLFLLAHMMFQNVLCCPKQNVCMREFWLCTVQQSKQDDVKTN